ncbi:MAG: exodeoxyribonuclease I [Spirochaetales bacterium]|nr:exodeoxyribonuclease I [Spirochaetales bacterium]
MAQTLLWYDLETFGTNPLGDRIAQFAAIRTTDAFEPLGDPLLLYNTITPDYLPDPRAVMVTGITPQITKELGMSEYEFITEIRKPMTVPGTTVVGYNSIAFDDEFIRAALYRNFYDPYEREWQGGNSRWDILNLARAAHDLRPEGINWPTDEGGKPSFRLELLTQANNLGHDNAHDALSDVRATIALAKLIHDKQPKLFRFYFSHRKKEEQRKLVDFRSGKPLLHTAGSYSNQYGASTLIAPLAFDQTIRNNLIALDLGYDPSPLLDLDAVEIRRRVFSRKEELSAEEELFGGFGLEKVPQGINQGDFGGRIPILTLGLNRCPFLAPLDTLTPEAATRLHIDTSKALERAKVLQKHPQLIQKITSIFAPDEGSKPAPIKDPDFQIYSGGFFRDEDKEGFKSIHHDIRALGPEQARPSLYALGFIDPRIPQMLRRFFARNFPETLSTGEVERWKSFCAGRILSPPVSEVTDLASFSKIVLQKMESPETPARSKVILKALMDYKKELEETILAYRPEGIPQREL